jgi:nucleotide-binding universal stress UspA family protein
MTGAILVGVALRGDDDAVLALAHELATATNAPLVLCHAYPFQPLIAVPPPEWVEELRAESDAQLRALADGAPTICRAGPSPVRLLHEAAEELGAELIVVGSSHRGPAGRVLPGGVGERLLHGAPCPVAIAPRGYMRPPAGLRRIGVATGDGSEAAASYALADSIARAAAAEVRTYTVDGLRAPARQDANDRVVLHGDVAAELAAVSGELDLLLTGSRGYGRLRSRLAGGVTTELAHTARCPLIVVGRAPTEAAHR